MVVEPPRSSAPLPGPVFRELFDASEVAYLVTTPDLTMVAANAAYLRGVGQPLAELVGRDVFEVFGNNPARPEVDQAGMVRTSMRRAVESGRTDRLLAVRYDIPTSDGSGFEVRWWNITNTPVVDSDGVTAWLLHYTDDITTLVMEREAGEAAAAVTDQLREQILGAEADLLARASELHALNQRLRAAGDHDRSVAQALQQAMLTRLPQPERLYLVARYRTASHDDQVGGDWYDAVVLPTGATTVMVGDVVGHDIAAAAVMGQLRSMLRALAWAEERPPSQIVAQLDRAMRDLKVGSLATLVMANIEQTAGDTAGGPRTIRWTNAGHPPPVLLDPDGHATALDATKADLLLGVNVDTERHDHVHTVRPGSTLLLYTDGLVETRTGDIEDGVNRLLRTVEARCGLPTPDMVDAVLTDMTGDEPMDDIAVLAVSFHLGEEPRPFEAGPAAAPALRRRE